MEFLILNFESHSSEFAGWTDWTVYIKMTVFSLFGSHFEMRPSLNPSLSDFLKIHPIRTVSKFLNLLILPTKDHLLYSVCLALYFESWLGTFWSQMKIEHLKQDFMTVCTFFAWACAIRFNIQCVLQINASIGLSFITMLNRPIIYRFWFLEVLRVTSS